MIASTIGALVISVCIIFTVGESGIDKSWKVFQLMTVVATILPLCTILATMVNELDVTNRPTKCLMSLVWSLFLTITYSPWSIRWVLFMTLFIYRHKRPILWLECYWHNWSGLTCFLCRLCTCLAWSRYLLIMVFRLSFWTC